MNSMCALMSSGPIMVPKDARSARVAFIMSMYFTCYLRSLDAFTSRVGLALCWPAGEPKYSRLKGVSAMAFVHGGRLVAQALKRHGTTHLFTLCGGHIQAIYDGCIDEGIRVVDVRHEQTAGHAADGYARVTGRPGVCAVTAGPGITDTVTALANAQRAGVPLVCIGGAGPR